jgi:hypothetical protein
MMRRCGGSTISEQGEARESKVTVNEGTLDRWVRIIAGLAILSLVPTTPFAWLGLIPLLTGVAGYCPLYGVLGVRTCKAKAGPPS